MTGKRLIEHQVQSYLEWCEFVKRMTPATILTKRKALERFIRVYPLLSDLALLTNSQFDGWRVLLAKENKSGKTINNYADHVVGCIRWLQTYCKTNVLLDFDLIQRAEEDEPEISWYTPEEIQKALQYCRGPRDDLLLSLFTQSGLRLTEAATLKIEKIDGLKVEVLGKHHHRRRTFIREDTKEKLDKWLKLNDIYQGYIFPSPLHWNGHISPQQIRDDIKGILERAGINKRNAPHDLRHTWFTMMLDSGAPLMDTAIMGGHTDPRTTSRYYHVSGHRHAALHKQHIPTMVELGTKKPVDNRPQELY